ncbi:hypothetical protein [Ornithinimicrobium kibberense]|uniref:hypothetical protein n=1 Tax=Ornithinimicrobium kibberense TaxID=282060 RepID=UPI00361DA702
MQVEVEVGRAHPHPGHRRVEQALPRDRPPGAGADAHELDLPGHGVTVPGREGWLRPGRGATGPRRGWR